MSADFCEFILVIGDAHIPDRKSVIPQCFLDLLRTDKIKHVACLGNMGSGLEFMDDLFKNCENIHRVRGDLDQDEGIPEETTFTVGQFRFGMTHGHQIIPWSCKEALVAVQQRLDSDIFIVGHSHEPFVFERKGRLFLNPGSCTGARSLVQQSDPISPTFMLLCIQDRQTLVYLYKCADGEANVEMTEFWKP